VELMPEQYRIVLRAEPHPVAPILRLRMLLKRARRDYALKCVAVEQDNKLVSLPDLKQPVVGIDYVDDTWLSVATMLPAQRQEGTLAVNILQQFPSRYLRVADIEYLGGEATYTIKAVQMEDMGKGEQKPAFGRAAGTGWSARTSLIVS
jgi:hypothetical protein